ncbi:MAG: alpha/beta fold hydrolase [Proteobacteria bacterium]|jgi:triacylglycerol lipase|nr:alpha/beta fold hydrolase [Pseudomonadota bacterium]
MAFIHRFATPWGVYGAFRDQLGSIRGVYLRGNAIKKREDFRRQEFVILIHGFFQTRNIWEVMEDRLRFDGYGVISFDLGGLFWRFNTHPIDRSAQLIAEKIEKLSRRHGIDAFHILGHSKGGLIARRYVQHYGGDKRVKSVISLGTPHHGTWTALLAMPLMGFGLLSSAPLDLLPRSRVISRLTHDAFPGHIPLTSIYSKEDLLCPYWNAILRPCQGEPSLTNVRVRGIGHSQLTWDPGVYRIVRNRLENASLLWHERQMGTGDPIAAR